MNPRRLFSLDALWWLKPLAALAVVALCVLAGWQYARDRRDAEHTGADRQVIRDAGRALDSANADSARLAPVYSADTIRLRRTIVVADTLRRRVALTDTTTVRAALAADSAALLACTAVVTTGEARLSACEAKAAALTAQRDAWRRIATRPGPRLSYDLGAAYEALGATAGHWQLDAGAALRLAGPLSATASVQHTIAPHESPRVLVGARFTF